MPKNQTKSNLRAERNKLGENDSEWMNSYLQLNKD